MTIRPLSIRFYATLFIGIFLLILSFLGYTTYQEAARLEQRLHDASQIKAQSEIEEAINSAVNDFEAHTKDFAAWDEVRQQLQNPIFYTYWYSHRGFNRNILPDHVIDIALYDHSGRVLSNIDTSLLPFSIQNTKQLPYLQVQKNTLYMVVTVPVIDPTTEKTIGYASTVSNFLPELIRLGSFSQIDPYSLSFTLEGIEQLVWTDLHQHILFKLRNDPLAEALKGVMKQAVLRLAVLTGIVVLCIFPLAAWLIGKPIRQIAHHIDLLKRYSRRQPTESFEKAVPILELDKVRKSLNDYHNQLNEVTINLDEKNQELWKMAHHDPLTGARNRRAFDEYWQEINDIFSDSRHSICLALIDINHFKSINDSYGHQVGDEVLIALTQVIQQVLRKNEYLFRLGGDEFATILIDCNQEKAQQIAERLQHTVATYPFDKLGIKEPVRISIGLAQSDATEAEPLIALKWQADVAMYTAKRPGHSQIAHYSPDLEKGAKGLYSNWTQNAVFEAVTEGTGILMHYQPIVKMVDSSVQYYEALVRIYHDDEMIMPSHIFPLVEARRLEADLDRMVIEQILMDLKAQLIPASTGISINLSPPAVVDSDIIQQLKAFQPFMQDYNLVLEITETALITQLQTATQNLSLLREMGFKVALDDFGSGYSSLRYLATMPVDIVKFDISLTKLIDVPTHQPILTHLTKMIKESGYKLVAEGIESKEVSKKLLHMGFELGQGYYFGKPLVADKLETLPEPIPSHACI